MAGEAGIPGIGDVARLVDVGQAFRARALLIRRHHDQGDPDAPSIRAALGRLWELDVRARLQIFDALPAETEDSGVDPIRFRQLRWLLVRRLHDLREYLGDVAPDTTVSRAMGAVEAERLLIEALGLEDAGDLEGSRANLVQVVEGTTGWLERLGETPERPIDLEEDLNPLRGREEVLDAWADFLSQRSAPAPRALRTPLRTLTTRLDRQGLDALIDLDAAGTGEIDASGFPRIEILNLGRSRRGGAGSGATPGGSGQKRRRRRGSDGPGEPPPGEQAGGALRTIRRTPHIDPVPKLPLPPGTELTISVWADTRRPRKGEEVTPIDVEVPTAMQRIELIADLLLSDHFEPVGATSLPLPLEVSRAETDRIAFAVKVRSEADLRSRFADPGQAATGGVQVVFRYQGRPAGRVGIAVPIALSAGSAERATRARTRPSGTIAVRPMDVTADLVVHVTAEPEGDDTEFRCALHTGLVPSDLVGRWHRWKLPRRAEQLVQEYMERFVDEHNDAVGSLGELRGAGIDLFDVAPAAFRELFWQMVEAERVPSSIAIVSEEPFIPWELMVPHRGDDARLPLGVEFAIGRYVPLDGTSAPQRFALGRSLVIAPDYRDSRDLAKAKSEVAYVLGKVPGTKVDPVVMESIAASLAAGPTDLIHFVGHGSAKGGQSLDLEQDQKLTATKVRGIDAFRRAFARQPTLVVLNACDAGRPAPALTGVGGLAQALIAQRAGGVIAALWSVEDDIAHEIAKEFYEEALKEPARPFAEILRSIRARAYDEGRARRDTYAAYCFYGDPHAARG